MRVLKKDIILMAIVTVLVFLLYAILNTSVDWMILEKNERVVRNYDEILQTVVNYDKSKNAFRLYNRNRNEDYYDDYQRNHQEVMRGLANQAGEFKKNESTQMYYRIVSQMLEERSRIIQDYVRYEVMLGRFPEDSEYISILGDRISTQLNNLMSAYLEQINTMNFENMEMLKYSQTISNGIVFIIAIIISMMCLYIAKKIKTKFHEITYVIQEIGKRNFFVKDINCTHYQDMNILINTANNMKTEIRNLIIQTEDFAEQKVMHEQRRRLLAESRIKELQLQINPHFLFNTLSIAIRHIQLDEKDVSIQLIKETSKILRSSFGSKKQLISLDEEIELLKSYIFIQQLHLKNRVDIFLDIQKAYGGPVIYVPPLVIQPIVENSVTHGMKETSQKGLIEIKIIEFKEYVQVEVKDNGIGMSKERCEEIVHNKSTDHVGSYNVIRRLQLLYHRDDVMKIESEEGQGTIVTIKLYKKEVF